MLRMSGLCRLVAPFVLALVPAHAGSTSTTHTFVLLDGRTPVGLCTEHRRETNGVLALERVYEWPRPTGGITEVRHVETRDSLGWRMSWRELTPKGSSLHAERTLDGRLTWRAWDPGDTQRGAWDRTGTLFPLEAIESVRAGSGPKGTFELYEPTTRARAQVTAMQRVVEGGGLVVEWVRVDGVVVGSMRFEAGELVEFGMQAGGVKGVRVTEERAGYLRSQW